MNIGYVSSAILLCAVTIAATGCGEQNLPGEAYAVLHDYHQKRSKMKIEARRHKLDVRDDIDVSIEEIKYKVFKPRQYGDEAKLSDKKRCYVKLAKGSEWSVVRSFDCDDKDIDRKKLLRDAKGEYGPVEDKEFDDEMLSEAEIARTAMNDFKDVVKFMYANTGFDLQGCMAGVAERWIDAIELILEQDCDDFLDDDDLIRNLMASMTGYDYVNSDGSYNEKYEAELKKQGDQEEIENHAKEKALHGKLFAWAKSLSSDEAERIVLARRALARRSAAEACHEKWMSSDASRYARALAEAHNLCFKVSVGKR